MNILIVDDIATNRRLLSAILEAEDHTVLEAADGVEAMAVLQREKVDAIISDILMPRMDGYRFCYEVRAGERFRHLPFIFYTSSYTSPSDEKLALEMGGDKFLIKPSPASKILQALREATTEPRRPLTPAEPSRELNLMKEYNQQLVAKLEQKNAELTARNEELLSSEQQLLLKSTALDTAANAALITDARGIILWVNPAFTTLTGYSSVEVIGKTPRLLKSGRHDREFYKNLWETILAGRTWRGSFTNRRKDGTLYYDEHTITPVRSEDGSIIRFVAIMNDVTERRKAEAALKKSEGRFRLLVEQAVDAFFLHDDQGKFLEVNHRACESLGYSKEELLTMNVADVACLSAEEAKNIWDQLRAGSTITVADHHRRKDGTRFPVEVRLGSFDSDGQKLFLGLARDVTERERAEEALRSVSSGKSSRNQKRVLWDLTVIVVLSVLVFVTCYQFGLSDESFQYIASHDEGAGILMDEGIFALLFFCLALLVFSYRRWRESRAETLSQTQISQALGILHKEMEAQVQQRTAQLVQTNEDLRKEITERQRAEAIIRQFPAIIESTDDAVISKTLEGVITSWNPAAERMFGYTASEIIGQPITLLFPSDRLREEDEIQARLARGERMRHLETVRVRKDGRQLDVSATHSPIKDADGKITGVSKIVRDISDRKRAEEALRDSEAKFRTLFDVANDAILMLHDGVFVDSNAKGLELFGVTRDQLIGQSPIHFSPPKQPDGRDSQEKAMEFIQKAMAGEPQFFEWVLQRPDGTPVYTDVTLSRLTLGGKVYLQAIARDITGRKRTEEALQKERDFTSAVVDTVSALVVVLDRQARIVSFNRACAQLTGYSLEEVKGRDVMDLLVMPEERVEARAELGKLNAGHFPNAFENHWVTRAGNPRLVAWSNTALLGADNTVEYVIATGTDITERKQAAEKIAEQAALLDQAQDAIIQRDVQGKILFWSKGAERIYGWTREEATGSKIADMLGISPEGFEEDNPAAQGKEGWSGEYKHFTKDRREVMIQGRCTLIRDHEGHPKSVLVINTDITEKKKIEAQFMRAQRMESIGTLAGGIAHDLNNILAPIMMSIDVLKTMSDHPQAKKILETIEVSAKRGSDIVRQVLSFARGLEGERDEIQPKHLLKDLEHIIKDTFPKDIRLQFSIPNNTWTILGDPTQVHQILLNLCVNARDAMPHGGTLTIGVENSEIDEQYAAMNLQARPGRYVKISVADTGTGIPPGVLDKIFEPFFTTKALNKGTGLGLSTVMAIVKSHEGIINVYSEPGRGTTFRVYLPAMEMSPEARKEQSEQVNLPRGNGETVLVVDDEASILTITSQTLEAFGYRVLTATDGAEAVATYAQHRNEIAVVLTDMAMPVMDGPATIRALMRINPEVKIIAASGLNANGGVATMSGTGVKHFLTKPYTAGTLLKTLRAILSET